MNTILRKWRLEDAKLLAEMLNNKKIQDNLRDGLPFPYTEKDASGFIHDMLAADPTQTFAFAITNTDDQAIGSIGAFRCENIHRQTAEMGYYLAEEYWGRGFGTRAVKELTDYLFAETDIIRIFAEPFTTNHGSCRVLEKCGFQLEGTLRKNAIKNGEIKDMQMYALVK
ncbi:GNAT family N-acetyltransferase [Candidatus Enterococcus murrayae]|uniref:GNAT family N-acetyltransferase n=1 Tax=Candidatus Enterococcus murrayae TaxID=2815321 RepID=A0ABS3HI42_9ENTE|nr:GNAT family protein [Enterococcus sp. MJM16]MBO0453110.1 GNAT family N-acetyltransferase [Enterococcus sp. MJM16]